MNQTAVLNLSQQLAQAVLDDEWKAALILAADLQAAWLEPQPVSPWAPWNQRNSFSAFKPGGAL